MDTLFEISNLRCSYDKENHGLGTSIVRSVAEKYDGAADFSYEEGEFTARVMLALPDASS